MFFRCTFAFAAVVTLGLASSAHAVIYPLDTVGASATINGGSFLQTSPTDPTGTGLFMSFLAVHGTGQSPTEQGYNHDLGQQPGEVPIFDEDLAKTENLLFSQVPIINYNGIDHLEFLLDLGEPRGGGFEKIDLTEMQIFISSSVNPIVTTFTNTLLDYPGSLRYDLDGDGDDNTVVLDGTLAPGNGKRDLTVLLPLSMFNGAQASDFVVLYTKFERYDGSFEEWGVGPATQTPPPPPAPEVGVPEPMSATMLLTALAATMVRSRRRSERNA